MTPRKSNTKAKAAARKTARSFVDDLAYRLHHFENEACLLQDCIEELPEGSAERTAAEAAYDAGFRSRQALQRAIASAAPESIRDAYLILGVLQKRLAEGIPDESVVDEIQGGIQNIRRFFYQRAGDVPDSFGENDVTFGIPQIMTISALQQAGIDYDIALGKRAQPPA
ncbi:MAG: hypothetical protein LCH56_05895 [Proteobacteria bacterium]|nr:hypothetical protein [Pseudomonadota bacterium]